ncbi:MAG: peptidylprolyl isomerase [Ignavibacteriaceae bacterium]
MRVLIISLLLCNYIFAQYNSTMYYLIRTTYERSFDSDIIYKYLNSDSEQEAKSALLSIAQSDDTLFIPEILKLDLNKFGNEVCFTLGQIGHCRKSLDYLWNYLRSSPHSAQYPKIFFAIGKIGNKNDLDSLIRFYNSFHSTIFPYEGISEAVLQFHIRGIKSEEAKSILEKEVINNFSDNNRITKALFALFRYGGSNKIIPEMTSILTEDTFSENLKQYSLMNFGALKTFHETKKNILDTKSINLKIHYAKDLCYLNFELANNLDLFFDYLNDANENVSLQSAVSLKNISLPLSLNKEYISGIKQKIDSLLYDNTMSESFRGELFLSRYQLFKGDEEHNKLLNKLDLPAKYKIQFYGNCSNEEIAFKNLLNFYLESENLTDKIEALTQLLNKINGTNYHDEFYSILISSLNSEFAPLISIAADGMDSSFISSNKDELKKIILNKINLEKDNPDFLESTMSLINLARKIDKGFYQLILDESESSKLYSIRKFISNKTGHKLKGFKELDNFEDIWDYAFKYNSAIIKTNKGEIEIQFYSGIAPVSVADFCMLADKNFYNQITFHRVVPGFVIQAGDPTATGWGGPGYDIISEFSDTDFKIGYVGMASAGKDTEGSQFFIMQGSYPHLNNRYTLFAKVINGMDIVYNITQDDRIISIKLIK